MIFTLAHIAIVGSLVWHETLEEGQRTYWQKCYEYDNRDEDRSPNTLNDKNSHNCLIVYSNH